METFPCKVCSQQTRSYLVHLSEVLTREPSKEYICHSCIEPYLDDKQIDVVMEYSLGQPGTKWEGKRFFEKAIIIDGPMNNLYAYSHRAAHSWKNLYHSARVWYDTRRQAEVGDLVNKFFNKPKDIISPKQLKYLNTLLSDKGTLETRGSIYERYKIDSLKSLSKDQATETIDRILRVKGVI